MSTYSPSCNSSAHKPSHTSTGSWRSTPAPNQPHRCTRRQPTTPLDARHTAGRRMTPKRTAGAPIGGAPRRATQQAGGLPRGTIRDNAALRTGRTVRVAAGTASGQPSSPSPPPKALVRPSMRDTQSHHGMHVASHQRPTPQWDEPAHETDGRPHLPPRIAIHSTIDQAAAARRGRPQ